ncbi:MAG: hypothetical protein NUV47_03625 [Patescibacteria group bacterium]|nr:hypothetical protein [Patescibacteria group bacterium]
MSNFSQKLEEIEDEQLKMGVKEHDPRYGVLESNELIKRSVNKLEKTIETFNKQSSKQTEKMIGMTKIITILTSIMVIGLLVQILLAVNYSHNCSGGKTNDGPWIYSCITTFRLGVLGDYSFQKQFTRNTSL